MALTVKQIMTQNVVALLPGDSLNKALGIMKKKKIRHLPVVDRRGTFIGIFSHRDLLAASASFLTQKYAKNRHDILRNTTVDKIMRKRAASTTTDKDVRHVAKQMRKNKLGCMPVLKGKKLVGIVTASDFLTLSINLLSLHEDAQRELSKKQITLAKK